MQVLETNVISIGRFVSPLVLALIGLIVVAAYLPGLHGPFVFDDPITISQNRAVTDFSFDVAGVRQIAHQGRPLAIASFALNWRLADGGGTFAFKLTNLLIHLVNTGLVFWLTRLLTISGVGTSKPNAVQPSRDFIFPFVTTALWALHPIQLTSVLYVVQRMTSLSATCVLAGLITFLHGRQRIAVGKSGGAALMWTGLTVGALLGFGFKENAPLILLYAVVIEFAFFSETWHDLAARRRIFLIYLAPFLLLSTACIVWLVGRSESFGAVYLLRNFTLTERLLTEARVLWFYMGLIVIPQVNHFALYHDDITISTSLLSPWTTPFAIAGLTGAIVLAIVLRRRAPMLSFAVLWFLVGQSLESSFIGLEIAHEHRNYLPSLGPIMGIAYGLSQLVGCGIYRKLIIALCMGLIASLSFTTYVLASKWAKERTLAEFLVRQHPASARTHIMLADMYYLEQHEPVQAMQQYLKAAELAPYETAFLIRIVNIALLTTISVTEAGKPTVPSEVDRLGIDTGLQIIVQGDHIRLRPTQALLELIASRLGTLPVLDRTRTALSELVDCAVQQPRRCHYLLNDLIRWHEIALHNVRTGDRDRPGLLLSLVRLYLENGDYTSALTAARRARALDPDDGVLALMEANVLLLSGKTGNAERILSEVLSKPDRLAPDEQREAEKLRRMLEEQRGFSVGHRATQQNAQGKTKHVSD